MLASHKKIILIALLSFFLISPNGIASPKNPTKADILRNEGIKQYKVPIYEQSAEWLIQEFGPGDPYPINLTLATKNIVWQVREGIRKGEISKIKGIIRTFWYTNIKPVFARTGSLNEDVDQSEVLNRVLVELVRDENLMRYKDMGFLDNNSGTVRIGKNWHVMLVGEKHGKFPVLEQIAKELNCTVLTLGGQPSLLSMEYLVDAYKEQSIDIRKSIYLIFVVDYDPAGCVIRDSVVKDLKFYGMSNIKAIDIILPDILTKEELKLAKFPLPKTQKTMNEKWLQQSGGINGFPFGFESDSVPFEHLRTKILTIATPYVGSPEIIRRANTVNDLWKSLNYFVQARLGLIARKGA